MTSGCIQSHRVYICGFISLMWKKSLWRKQKSAAISCGFGQHVRSWHWASGIVRHRRLGWVGLSPQRSSSLAGTVAIVKGELLDTNRDWPLNSWAPPPSKVRGIHNCLMNKSLNKSALPLRRGGHWSTEGVQRKKKLLPGGKQRLFHEEAWLMESWEKART